MLRHRVLTTALLLSAAAATVAATEPPAGATPLVVAQARGFFLAGVVQGLDLDTAARIVPGAGNTLPGAEVTNTGGPTVTESNPQSLGDLGSVTVPGAGGTVPLGSALRFGVLNQFATAGPDGRATASSGAIADNGTLQAGDAGGGPAGDATLDLAGLGASFTDGLPTAVRQLGDVSVTAGALAARATQDPFVAAGTAGSQQGSYRIGSLVVTLQGPSLLADALQAVRTGLENASSDLDRTLTSALAALAPAGSDAVQVDISGLPDPDAALDGLTTVTADGVTVDLAHGTITLDLAALLAATTGQDINDLPPNTDLLPLVQQGLTDTDLAAAVAEAIGTAVTHGQQSLLDALGSATATVTVAGVPIPLSGGTLLTLLGVDSASGLPGVDGLTAALASLSGGLPAAFGSLLGAVGSGLAQLVGLTVNVQERVPGPALTERALVLDLLPRGFGSQDPLLYLQLANATVFAGSLVAASTPPATATPSTPTLAETGPRGTLGGLAVGTWAVVAGIALLYAAAAVRRRHVGTHQS